MRSGSEKLNCPEFASLITASGFIEHTKAVAGEKLAGKDLSCSSVAEMPFLMAVLDL